MVNRRLNPGMDRNTRNLEDYPLGFLSIIIPILRRKWLPLTALVTVSAMAAVVTFLVTMDTYSS